MRYALILLVLMMLFASFATAADITLTWDIPEGQTWQSVRIYEKDGDGKGGILYALKSEVPGTQTQATITNVTPGVHVYVARSVAQPWGESVDSNTASTDPANIPPDKFRILSTVTVEVVVPK